MENEDRSSSGSTVSEIFKTVLKSPLPACVFYFSHPFGISSPSTCKRTFSAKKSNYINKTIKDEDFYKNRHLQKEYIIHQQKNLISKRQLYKKGEKLVAWPRETWHKHFSLPPLIHFSAHRKGELHSDLETILRIIRENSSNSQSMKSCSNIILSSHLSKNSTTDMIEGSLPPSNGGLLRRRYSLPEIIMRKHSLAKQTKSYNERMTPMSSSPIRTPVYPILKAMNLSGSHPTIYSTSNFESNIVRGFERPEMSMRKTALLRRMWSKELRKNNIRSGSCSPPQRGLNKLSKNETIRCEECRKLELLEYSGNESPKRIKLISEQENKGKYRNSIKKSNQPGNGELNLLFKCSDLIELKNCNQFMISNEKLNESTKNTSNDDKDRELDHFISQLLLENLQDLTKDNDIANIKKNEKKVAESYLSNKNLPERVELHKIQRQGLELKNSINNTNEEEKLDMKKIPSGSLIQINTGSSYHDNKMAQFCSRIITNSSRTESLEVNSSSVSVLEEHDGHESDDSISLVDSLDDIDGSKSDTTYASDNKVHQGKSEAFFIPITDENQIPKDLTVSNAMPIKIREKLFERQQKLYIKRQAEQLKKKEKLMEKIHNPTSEGNKHQVICTSGETKVINTKEKLPKKINTTILRNEISLLKSYTIDSTGNLQLNMPIKANKNTSRKNSKLISRSCKRKSLIQSNDKTTKEVQKMTIFQPQSNTITPDIENGPKRVLQKTEILDGKKRIEILEIVECIETTSPKLSADHFFTHRSVYSKKSKIPIPINKSIRSICKENSNFCLTKETINSDQIDQNIAEILINSLNHSDGFDVNFLKSSTNEYNCKEKGIQKQITQRRNTPRRSATSAKYQQVFEVIPEEKSSLSLDSSSDEKLIASISNTNTGSGSNSQRTINFCRTAIDSVEPNAWDGFFECHNGSSFDEDETITQEYRETSTEISRQDTITSPSAVSATAGSINPKISASTFDQTSSEQETISKLIDKTFEEKKFPNTVQSEYSFIPKTTTTDRNCDIELNQFGSKEKKFPNSMKHYKTNIEKKILLVEIGPCILQSESSSAISNSEDYNQTQLHSAKELRKYNRNDVWRIQSPNLCKRIVKGLHKQIHKTDQSKEYKTGEDNKAHEFLSNKSITNIYSNNSCLEKIHLENSSCDLCCFCNPRLHSTNQTYSKICLFCSRKKTPPKKEEETNTEQEFSNFFNISNKDKKSNWLENITKTQDNKISRTKNMKIDKKLKKGIPSINNTNLNSKTVTNNEKTIKKCRSKSINNFFKKNIRRENLISTTLNDQNANFDKCIKAKTCRKVIRLPNPCAYEQLSRCHHEHFSSTSSLNSICKTTSGEHNLKNFQKCQVTKKQNKVKSTICSSEDKTNNNGNRSSNEWSVTVTGSCKQDLTPDVEMRLSFPRKYQTNQWEKQNGHAIEKNMDTLQKSNICSDDHSQTKNNNNESFKKLSNPNFPVSSNVNQRRKALPLDCIHHNHRNMNLTKMNPRQIQESHNVMCRRPLMNSESEVMEVASKKRTVKKFAQNNRSMSFNSLNSGFYNINDQSQFLSSSALEMNHHLSLNGQNNQNIKLSIMGNAIIPEPKPYVLKMSERDLTRKHNIMKSRSKPHLMYS